MLVLLPPSETKRGGGDGPPLRLDALAHPELNPLRAELVDELVKLAGDADGRPGRAGAVAAAGRGGGAQRRAVDVADRARAAPLHRGALRRARGRLAARGGRGRARRRLAVGSALFGLLTADDPVPAYRLSAGSALPGRGTLAAAWRPVLEPVLAAVAARELVVDLRSGSYAALARVPGAVTVTRPHGRRARSSATSTRRTRVGSRGCWRARGRSRPTRRGWRRWPAGRACTWTAAAHALTVVLPHGESGIPPR